MILHASHRQCGQNWTARVESPLMAKTRASGRTPADAKLGKYLASARESGGMSQEQLAKKMGRVQSFVAKTETGKRRLGVVEFVELAKALGVPPQQLLEGVLKQLR
jgi:ribosome-binding protein aMBF1 (putative translation factor)